MEVQCTKCKQVLAKIAGKALVLAEGHYLSGQEFSIILKCKCGEINPVNFVNGQYDYDGTKNTDNQTPGRSGKDDSSGKPSDDSSGEGTGEGKPGSKDSDPSSQSNSGGSGTGKPDGNQNPLPAKPKSWITGKVQDQANS